MFILCFESGGTKLVASVADSEGNLLTTQVRPRAAGQTAAQTLDHLSDLGRQVLEGRTPSAIGFGFGGTVRRSDRRPIVCFHEEGWEDIDAPSILADRFGVPVLIENDCKLAALAEAWQGGTPPGGTLIYATLGTGIGAGIVRRGYLVELGEIGEAEIGHIVVEPEGLPCGCGNRGCLEAYCSGPGLTNLARSMTGRDIEPEELMQRFRQGESTAQEIAERAAGYLARVLSTVVNLLSPEEIVLGGGVMTDNRRFLELVRDRTARWTFAPFWSRVREWRLSRLGRHVVCQGAAIYVLQQRGRSATVSGSCGSTSGERN
ncbi:MAG: ROK family protein [Acidobacteriota bacterium]